jgi:uracil-DNA glycosylase family 4
MKLKVLSSTASAFKAHKLEWEGCTKCTIGTIAHSHVFARGTLPCNILFIGEAPGKTEDMLGEPFVGRSGKLLDTWMEAAMGVSKFTYAIANLVLCRPCDKIGGPNRMPNPGEVSNCQPRLMTFVADIAKPRVIVTLGRTAEMFLPRELTTRRLHLAHPAWVLRQGGENSNENRTQKQRLCHAVRCWI